MIDGYWLVNIRPHAIDDITNIGLSKPQDTRLERVAVSIKRLCSMVNFGQGIVGIIVLLIVVGGLVYMFYTRTNAVQKNGYASVIMLAFVSVIIPVLWVTENSQQVAAANTQQALALQRGMVVYVQVCTDKCYAIDKNNKLLNAKYLGYTISDLNKKSDDDLKRTISAGIYNPAVAAPANLNTIPRSTDFNGQLLPDQVTYLFALIRSTDPTYAKKQGFTGAAAANGFDQLSAYLQASAPNQYTQAQSLATAGQFGTPIDMTSKNAITINMVQPPPGSSCMPACFDPINVKVKVGTKITWVNKSPDGHTVSAIVGTDTAAHKVAPQIFDSGLNKLIQSNASYSYTVTAAAYNFNADHTVIYYCQVHPMMLAELTIVQ
jgi:plastocyanin